jgi:hypothetical protein
LILKNIKEVEMAELQDMWNYLVPYSLLTLKAFLILVIGWIIAVISRNLIVSLLRKIKFFKEQEGVCESTGNLVYYFILLITSVAVLEVFGLKYVTQPLIDLLNKIAVYIPNVIGASIILVVGVLFARVAKEFTKSLLEAFQVENLSRKYQLGNLKDLGANIVYFVILLFVIVASLNALQLEAITEPAVSMLNSILLAIPKIIAASIVFLITYYIGKVIADMVIKIIDDLNIKGFINEIGLSHDKLEFEKLVRYLILSFVVLIGLSQAFSYLDARALYDITYTFIHIAFKLLVASIIVLTGVYFGNLFEKRVENKNLGKILKVSFIVASLILSLPYIGISSEIVEVMVLSISLGVGLAFALAFGLGGKEVASEMLKNLLNRKKD